jgi:hypothetical protein
MGIVGDPLDRRSAESTGNIQGIERMVDFLNFFSASLALHGPVPAGW